MLSLRGWMLLYIGLGNVYTDAAMKYLANNKKEDDKDGTMADETNVDKMAEDIGTR